ncbi:MAG: hypothetical protein KDD82_04855, partial [Planctomycetes bacterium]|nr:hypothetical protein [Planctomycetota bacterium]
AERLHDVRLALAARVALGYATARAGYLDRAQATLEQARDEARELEDPLWEARARIGLADVLAGQGDPAAAQLALDPLREYPLPKPLRARVRLAQLAVDWAAGERGQIGEQLEAIAANARERGWGELEREAHARLTSVRASERMG